MLVVVVGGHDGATENGRKARHRSTNFATKAGQMKGWWLAEEGGVGCRRRWRWRWMMDDVGKIISYDLNFFSIIANETIRNL
jgi:hypothetical protein